MKTNPYLHDAIMSIVENQLSENNPVETRETLDRLMLEGWSEENSLKLIGQCVVVELFGVMKYKAKFNEKRFIRNLKNLPKTPTE